MTICDKPYYKRSSTTGQIETVTLIDGFGVDDSRNVKNPTNDDLSDPRTYFHVSQLCISPSLLPTTEAYILYSLCSVSKKKVIRNIRKYRFSRQLLLLELEVSSTRLDQTRSTTPRQAPRAAATLLSFTLLSITSPH